LDSLPTVVQKPDKQKHKTKPTKKILKTAHILWDFIVLVALTMIIF
jgi:hypothetical protein